MDQLNVRILERIVQQNLRHEQGDDHRTQAHHKAGEHGRDQN